WRARGVAGVEASLRAAGTGVKVGRPGAGRADPPRVGLRRDDVPQVLQAVQDVHRAVLDAILVAGDQAAADPAVVDVLPGVVEQVRAGVQPLDDLLHHRGVVAEPDRPGEHQDVGDEHLLVDLRPFVGGPAVLGHVRPYAGGDVMVHRAEHVDRDALFG